MLLRNEDVGHSRLARHFAQRGLDRGSVVDLVELDGVELCAGLAEQFLCLPAVGAVGFGEDGDGVLRVEGLVGLLGKDGWVRTSSMMDCTLVFVADIVPGERDREDEVKRRARKEMVAVFSMGCCWWASRGVSSSVGLR